MAAEKRTISIGPVRSIPKGTYNPILDYEYLNIVKTDDASYICCNRLGAPSGISIEDEDYWQRLARDGQDGAVSFATQKEYENEVANKAISPALIKPMLATIETRQDMFEKYGVAYDTNRFKGKTYDEVMEEILAQTINLKAPNSYVLLADGTITAPSWARYAIITGCAGGGGGGGGTNATTNLRGGTGGAGGGCVDYPVAITPGEVYTITIGTGGAGASRGYTGGTGGVTSFGNLASLSGGSGGAPSDGTNNGTNGTQGTSVASGSVDITSGLFGKAGAGRTSNGNGNRGTGYGSGGSGAHGTSASYYGAAGANGMLIVRWAI